MKLFLNKRGDIDTDTIVSWIIALVVLAISVAIIILVINGKGGVALEQIKNLMRFGR